MLLMEMVEGQLERENNSHGPGFLAIISDKGINLVIDFGWHREFMIENQFFLIARNGVELARLKQYSS